MTLTIVSPIAGDAVPLSVVPDPVFSAALVGPGTAVDPDRTRGTVVSPIDGRITKLLPHAFVVVAESGKGVLVHLGIDTVQLDGEGFTLLVNQWDHVKAGMPVVMWDPAWVEANGRSPICPVVALDAQADQITGSAAGNVAAGDVLFTWL
jgi:PTS system N-acetylglucosamine-specific IIA component